MNSYISKLELQKILGQCNQSIHTGDFADGIMLGLLLSKNKDDSEHIISIFDEWRNTADDMELDTEKRMFMYMAYMMTFEKGKLVKEQSLCRNETRSIKRFK